MDQQELVLKMEIKPDYLHVYAGGLRSRETVKELTNKVFQFAVENHLSKVLIDVRELVGSFGFKDIIFLVREVIQDLGGKGINQVAVIEIQRTVGLGWFLESVAQSYGLNIRVFEEEESALKWFTE